ncbi:MAG TPA: aldehyde dehydrogenase family protein, partial [Castellaniella sp.]|nr:aldehyde dehydrogenase family protein [Castellaniella sp.]
MSAQKERFSMVIEMNPDLFIGGQWRKGSRQGRIDVVDPATGNRIGSVADADARDAISAVDAAFSAGRAWASRPARERCEILRKCHELIIRDTDALARLISLENGKALKDARGEVAYAAEFFRWFSEEGVRIKGDLGNAPSGNNQILVQYQPIGVSLLVTPWNFPAAMATRKIAPALAAGCTCILKPATATPLTAYAVARILTEAGVPDGVVNVVTTSKTGEVVDTILKDPRVRKLSFTGSTEV